MAARKLTAEERKVLGRKVKQLRRAGILPANIYGKKLKSRAVQVRLDEFQKVFGETGETGLVELKVNGEAYPVLIHNVQLDPVGDFPLHADFLKVDLKEKVGATVPIELVGESPAEKEGGVVVQQMHEIEVEALPTDLPEKIEVDVSALSEIDQAIKVGELKVDKTKVEVKEDPERIVVSIAPPAKEEEVAPPPATEEAAPVEGEQAPAEETVEAPAKEKKEEVKKEE